MQEVADNIFVATHFRGSTVSAILTNEGYILIDAPTFPEEADRWRAFLEAKAGRNVPIRALILTDYNAERLLGAHLMKPHILIAHRATYEHIKSLPSSYVNTIANMLTRSPYEQSELSSCKIQLPVITFDDEIMVQFGKHRLNLVYAPGPTRGSIMVQYLPEKLLFSGDIIVVGTAPYLNNLQSEQWLATLNTVSDEKYPANIIIAGHGNITVKTAIVPITQYLETARERIEKIYDTGQSLSDTGRLVHELLNFFPPPLESELADVQHRVRNLLQSIYNEYRQKDLAATLAEYGDENPER